MKWLEKVGPGVRYFWRSAIAISAVLGLLLIPSRWGELVAAYPWLGDGLMSNRELLLWLVCIASVSYIIYTDLRRLLSATPRAKLKAFAAEGAPGPVVDWIAAAWFLIKEAERGDYPEYARGSSANTRPEQLEWVLPIITGLSEQDLLPLYGLYRGSPFFERVPHERHRFEVQGQTLKQVKDVFEEVFSKDREIRIGAGEITYSDSKQADDGSPFLKVVVPEKSLRKVAKLFRSGTIANNSIFSGYEYEAGSAPRRLALKPFQKMFGPGARIEFEIEVSPRGVERFQPNDWFARVEPDYERGETLTVSFHHEVQHAYQITASPDISCEVLNQEPGEFRVRLKSEEDKRVSGKLVVQVDKPTP